MAVVAAVAVFAAGALAGAAFEAAPFTRGLVGVLVADGGADLGLTSPFTAAASETHRKRTLISAVSVESTRA